MTPTSQATPARVDIYARIHKGIRAALTDCLQAAGRLDARDDDDVGRVIAAVRDLAALCRSHLEHENDYVHTAMEPRRPGSARLAAEDHVHHEADIARLESYADALQHLPALRREAAAVALYQELARFTADNLAHMAHEEHEHNRVLWETHSDAEIEAIEQAIVASHTPEESRLCWRWMLPAMTPEERAGLLAGIREQAPPEVFDSAVALVGPLLSAGELGKLRNALGIRPVIHEQVGVA